MLLQETFSYVSMVSIIPIAKTAHTVILRDDRAHICIHLQEYKFDMDLVARSSTLKEVEARHNTRSFLMLLEGNFTLQVQNLIANGSRINERYEYFNALMLRNTSVAHILYKRKFINF
jgi:hypothetical protein